MLDGQNEMPNKLRGHIAHLGNEVNPKYFHTQLINVRSRLNLLGLVLIGQN